MVNVRDLRTFHRFLRLCAGRNGQLLNLSNLAGECGITHNTAKAWISIQSAQQLDTHSMRGAIFEAYIVGELKKARLNRGLPDHLYFWRDRSGNEVDVLIDHGDQLQPIEIKPGQTLSRDQFEGLRRWLELAGNTATDPMLIYGGDTAMTRSGVKVFPWFEGGWLA